VTHPKCSSCLLGGVAIELVEIYSRVASETVVSLAARGGLDLAAASQLDRDRLAQTLRTVVELRWQTLVDTFLAEIVKEPVLLEGMSRSILRAVEADARIAAGEALAAFLANRRAVEELAT
jgi:hypothetical protein